MVEPTSRQWEEIDELISKDHTIQAIKAYRDITGTTLREAMVLIDTRKEALLVSHPERFQSESDAVAPSDEGCERR
jgi:ribosomal protein L7/L12